MHSPQKRRMFCEGRREVIKKPSLRLADRFFSEDVEFVTALVAKVAHRLPTANWVFRHEKSRSGVERCLVAGALGFIPGISQCWLAFAWSRAFTDQHCGYSQDPNKQP
jgi:hypothetical protein